ncbi:MAG: SpoIID/LytB domain-containing protein [Thermodesulfovibrionia bacterium]|nr:SpoIID/LytB domain-containing protein [Thermodesulfovibrionia bacterium]
MKQLCIGKTPSPLSSPVKGGESVEVEFPLPLWERVRVRGNSQVKTFLYLLAVALVFFTAQSLRAEDTIKVLIVESPYDIILAGNAEKIGNLNGEIFLSGSSYKGLVDVRRDGNGLYFITELPFEKYIEGVVASEIGKDWNMEAMKAQAVISRTYAVYQKNLNTGKDYHITSSVMHQVYKGDNTNEAVSKAVKDTMGEILTYEKKPVETFYHSTCTDKTELPEEVWGKSYPYLKSVLCMDKNSPYEHWVRRFSVAEIEKALNIKGMEDISISSFTSTGRVKMLRVVTEGSELEVKAYDLRKLLGYKELPSTQFSVAITGSEVVFEGSGYGHGVGLSQWGALELANEGKNYKEILQYYYPGTVLQKM